MVAFSSTAVLTGDPWNQQLPTPGIAVGPFDPFRVRGKATAGVLRQRQVSEETAESGIPGNPEHDRDPAQWLASWNRPILQPQPLPLYAECWYPDGPPPVIRDPQKPAPISLYSSDRRKLRKMVAAHTTEQRMALRARIVLLASLGRSNRSIAKELGVDLKTVRKWRDRFARHGMRGLADGPRSGRPARFGATQRCEVFTMAVSPPPKPYSRWTVDLLAEELIKRGIVTCISPETVSYWLRTADLKPHRVKYWLNSKDPQFHEKKRRVIDLYINPPTDGIVLCLDEKTGIQARELLHSDIPMSRRRARRVEVEYKRHGTVSLMASFEVHTGQVVGELITRNNSQTFIRFVKRLMARHQGTKLYLVLDNGSSHRSNETKAFFEQHSDQLVPVFLPTHASWLNQIEIWFSALTRQALRDVSFQSRAALCQTIRAYISHHNRELARPYQWTTKGKALKGATARRRRRRRRRARGWTPDRRPQPVRGPIFGESIADRGMDSNGLRRKTVVSLELKPEGPSLSQRAGGVQLSPALSSFRPRNVRRLW